MRSINPATGDVIAEYPAHSPDEVRRRIQAADDAFQSWRNTTFAERAELFQNLARALRESAEKNARLMTLEMGKPIAQSRSEVEKCAWTAEFFAERAAEFLKPQFVETDASRSKIVFEPLGVILSIMPWNFPFWQALRCTIPTMMAGNTALLKHASNVQGSAERLTELFKEAGFPPGAFDHLHIGSKDMEAVIRHRAIRGLTLTGSTGAGKAVGAIAGSELKPAVLELGGSDPFIVLADCDLDYTVEQATRARMINNGQSCIAAKRFIVEDAIYEAFLERFQKAIAALNVGDPLDENNDIGPLAREDLRDDLHDQVQRSIKAGARCLVGGKPLPGPGFFYQPTLLADVTPPMSAFCEETFGPVAAVTRAESVDQAIELANQSPYGLGASIWTDPTRGEELASQLDAGNVFINAMVKSDPRLPFGGVKDSGLGRELGVFGIQEFVNIKTVYVK